MGDKKFNILSIDGGGIRGIFPAKFLSDLESEIKGRGFSPNLYDHFDLICGTSTGGIIALGLALGISAAEMLTLYQKNVDKIFRKNAIPVFMPKHNSRHLESVLQEAFKNNENGNDLRISDAKTRICIPTYCLFTGKPRIFKTPHTPQLHIDKNIPAYQAAMATTAAPVYFKPYSGKYHHPKTGAQESLHLNVDGGIYANNPALIGLMEANRGLNVPLDQIQILSIGTGTSKFSESRSSLNWGSFPYWVNFSKNRIFDLMLQAQSQHVHDILLIMDGGVGAIKQKQFHYTRIQQDFNPDFKIEMNCRNKEKLEKLSSLAHTQFQQHATAIISDFIRSSGD
jgi:patatin-like phospholipase/acyl hydrolase